MSDMAILAAISSGDSRIDMANIKDSAEAFRAELNNLELDKIKETADSLRSAYMEKASTIRAHEVGRRDTVETGNGNKEGSADISTIQDVLSSIFKRK
jgi:hypothetical protein